MGGELLAFISNGSNIVSLVSLGFDIRAVISDYIKSNRKMDALVNRAVNQARKDANIGSQHYYGRPLNDEILKKDLLDLVQKKATNELKDEEIPNWLGKNDFEKFYDSIMQDVGFWNYLHQQIESCQHIIQLGKLDESKQLLKKIEAQIEILSQHSSKLPEWLRPYDKELSVDVEKSFLDDASENLIRDGKLLLNQSFINKVKQYLDEKIFCLIKAPEGRGKTYLSRIIAYDYHHNRGMEVYFIDIKECNGVSVTSIDDILQEWHKNNTKEYLLVIENVHAYKELEALRKLINQWVRTSGNHVWFLLNTRPTYVELDDFLDWEEQVELNPDGEDVNGIINLYSKEVGRVPFANDEERDGFVEKICPNQKTVSGANLRLLKIYLETWQYHPEIQYISGVKEQTVIERFRNLYLKNRSSEEIKALWYISSLFQFDVPSHEDFVQDVGNLVADGLLRFEENRYHLPHSVDASFLYKAICGLKKKSLAGQMKTFATRFVKGILDNDCPRDFESDFRLMHSGLVARKNEFREVIQYLTQEDLAKEIIMKLNPGYVLTFFNTQNYDDSNSVDKLLSYYEKNKDWLKIAILELNPAGFNLVFLTFKNHLGYSSIVKDVFENPDDLRKYLTRQFEFKNYDVCNSRIFESRIRSVIKSISPKHIAVLKEFNNRSNLNKTKYHLVSLKKKNSQIPISNTLILIKYLVYDKKDFQYLVSDLCTKGFYFDELTWNRLDKFLKKARGFIDETHREIFQKATKTLVQMIIDEDNMFLEKPNALWKASSAQLSYFLSYINIVDHVMYEETIANNKVIEAVKQKLGKGTRMTSNELYLFSRFYSQGWCKSAMDKLINNADDEQIEIIKQWFKKVKLGLDSRHITPDNTSLVVYIQQKFYSTDNLIVDLSNTVIGSC